MSFFLLVQSRLEELLSAREECKPFLEAVRKAENVCQLPELLERLFRLEVPYELHTHLSFVTFEKGIYLGKGTVVKPHCHFEGPVYIGENCKILSGCVFEGPVFVGDNCRIGPGAHLRERSVVGNNCHVGHASQIKNSVILNHSNAPHRNYVGDSVVGEHCNLGDGTKLGNWRMDEKIVRCKLPDGTTYETGRTKFGAIVEDGCKTGCNVTLNPGAYVQERTGIYTNPEVLVFKKI